MSEVTLQELVKAGVHFGHKKSRWNPRMEPFIHSKKNGMHIIDLRTTIRGLVRACHFLERLAQQSGEVLLVGTKHQIKNLIKSEATRLGGHYVSERWLGGTLTNYKTIRERLKRLEEIEAMERSGDLDKLSKKMVSQIARERRKLLRNLEGIRNMAKLPDVLIVVDPRREHIAIAEAHKLKIPTIALIDSDSDPEKIDIVIPANDDSFRSVQILLSRLVDAALRGKLKRDAQLGLATVPVAVAPAEVPAAVEEVKTEAGEASSAGAEAPAASAPAASAPAASAPAASGEGEAKKEDEGAASAAPQGS